MIHSIGLPTKLPRTPNLRPLAERCWRQPLDPVDPADPLRIPGRIEFDGRDRLWRGRDGFDWAVMSNIVPSSEVEERVALTRLDELPLSRSRIHAHAGATIGMTGFSGS